MPNYVDPSSIGETKEKMTVPIPESPTPPGAFSLFGDNEDSIPGSPSPESLTRSPTSAPTPLPSEIDHLVWKGTLYSNKDPILEWNLIIDEKSEITPSKFKLIDAFRKKLWTHIQSEARLYTRCNMTQFEISTLQELNAAFDRFNAELTSANLNQKLQMLQENTSFILLKRFHTIVKHESLQSLGAKTEKRTYRFSSTSESPFKPLLKIEVGRASQEVQSEYTQETLCLSLTPQEQEQLDILSDTLDPSEIGFFYARSKDIFQHWPHPRQIEEVQQEFKHIQLESKYINRLSETPDFLSLCNWDDSESKLTIAMTKQRMLTLCRAIILAQESETEAQFPESLSALITLGKKSKPLQQTLQQLALGRHVKSRAEHLNRMRTYTGKPPKVYSNTIEAYKGYLDAQQVTMNHRWLESLTKDELKDDIARKLMPWLSNHFEPKITEEALLGELIDFLKEDNISFLFLPLDEVLATFQSELGHILSNMLSDPPLTQPFQEGALADYFNEKAHPYRTALEKLKAKYTEEAQLFNVYDNVHDKIESHLYGQNQMLSRFLYEKSYRANACHHPATSNELEYGRAYEVIENSHGLVLRTTETTTDDALEPYSPRAAHKATGSSRPMLAKERADNQRRLIKHNANSYQTLRSWVEAIYIKHRLGEEREAPRFVKMGLGGGELMPTMFSTQQIQNLYAVLPLSRASREENQSYVKSIKEANTHTFHFSSGEQIPDSAALDQSNILILEGWEESSIEQAILDILTDLSIQTQATQTQQLEQGKQLPREGSVGVDPIKEERAQDTQAISIKQQEDLLLQAHSSQTASDYIYSILYGGVISLTGQERTLGGITLFNSIHHIDVGIKASELCAKPTAEQTGCYQQHVQEIISTLKTQKEETFKDSMWAEPIIFNQRYSGQTVSGVRGEADSYAITTRQLMLSLLKKVDEGGPIHPIVLDGDYPRNAAEKRILDSSIAFLKERGYPIYDNREWWINRDIIKRHYKTRENKGSRMQQMHVYHEMNMLFSEEPEIQRSPIYYVTRSGQSEGMAAMGCRLIASDSPFIPAYERLLSCGEGSLAPVVNQRHSILRPDALLVANQYTEQFGMLDGGQITQHKLEWFYPAYAQQCNEASVTLPSYAREDHWSMSGTFLQQHLDEVRDALSSNQFDTITLTLLKSLNKYHRMVKSKFEANGNTPIRSVIHLPPELSSFLTAYCHVKFLDEKGETQKALEAYEKIDCFKSLDTFTGWHDIVRNAITSLPLKTGVLIKKGYEKFEENLTEHITASQDAFRKLRTTSQENAQTYLSTFPDTFNDSLLQIRFKTKIIKILNETEVDDPLLNTIITDKAFKGLDHHTQNTILSSLLSKRIQAKHDDFAVILAWLVQVQPKEHTVAILNGCAQALSHRPVSVSFPRQEVLSTIRQASLDISKDIQLDSISTKIVKLLAVPKMNFNTELSKVLTGLEIKDKIAILDKTIRSATEEPEQSAGHVFFQSAGTNTVHNIELLQQLYQSLEKEVQKTLDI